jgi:hypothetical protein
VGQSGHRNHAQRRLGAQSGSGFVLLLLLLLMMMMECACWEY